MQNFVTSRAAILAEKVFELYRSRNFKFCGTYFHDLVTYSERHGIYFCDWRISKVANGKNSEDNSHENHKTFHPDEVLPN